MVGLGQLGHIHVRDAATRFAEDADTIVVVDPLSATYLM
jgi:hypothetical protein